MKTAFNLKDTADAFSYKGTWKFFAKHWRFGLEESGIKRNFKILYQIHQRDIYNIFTV